MADVPCRARIRPFRRRGALGTDTELACELEGTEWARNPGHHNHRGKLLDYAYPGSETVIEWADDDRRNFYGDWPGDCQGASSCLLPNSHGGNHAR